MDCLLGVVGQRPLWSNACYGRWVEWSRSTGECKDWAYSVSKVDGVLVLATEKFRLYRLRQEKRNSAHGTFVPRTIS